MDIKTQQSKENYDRKANEYESTAEGRFTLPFNRSICASLSLKDSDAVLDVACGNGRLLRMLSQKAKIKAFGVDVSEEMVKTAARENAGMTFACGGADKLPFEENTFDVVTVCCAFHHFTKPAVFLGEAKRVLKRGGKLLIADPYVPGVLRQIENLLLPLMKMGDVKIYSEKELQAFFQRAGFANVSIRQRENQLLAEGVK